MILNKAVSVCGTLCMALLLTLLQACASQPGVPGKPFRLSSVTAGEPGELWWAVRFRENWPEDTEADFTLDLLLAHAVIRPLLHEYEPVLSHWRFHRRASRDAVGHQFSFIFHATEDVARELYARIDSDRVLRALVDEQRLARYFLDTSSYGDRSRIEATSDPHWALPLQKSWPPFIQGVSQTWLQLIDEQMQGAPTDYTGTEAMLAQYEEAEAGVLEIWQGQGQHAFLHHLSAIFGYQPLLIQKHIRF